MTSQHRLSICVVVAARNELPYLRHLVPRLAAQDIDVVVVDNQSTDGSDRLYARHRNGAIRSVEHLPYRGYFSLTEQLRCKEIIYDGLPHDWVVHQDADEILEHRIANRSLRDAIEEADAKGYNALNFHEFVFVPEPDQDISNNDYYAGITRYYSFMPQENRLNRAWKRALNVQNQTTGGHRLVGKGLLIDPEPHTLRHYIVLSQEHAYRKYLNRLFDEQDLKLGWHTNRLAFSEQNLRLPIDHRLLRQLDPASIADFSEPCTTALHYWDWEPAP